MAEGPCIHLLLFLLFAHTVCSTGNLVGFYYDVTRDGGGAISFVQKNNDSPSTIRVFVSDYDVLKSMRNWSTANVSADLFLSDKQLEDLENSKNSVISWLKRQLASSFPRVKIKTIVVSYGVREVVGHKGLSLLLSALKSIQSIINSVNLHNHLKVSVAFSTSTLEYLDRTHERDLHRVINFIKKARSYLTIEADVDGEFRIGDGYVQSVIERASSVALVLRHSHLSKVFVIKSSVEKNTQPVGINTGWFVRVCATKTDPKYMRKESKMLRHSFPHRILMNTFELRRVSHDLLEPPPMITYPTTPVTNPPDTSGPTVVTVPATYPVTVTPTNPVSTPITVPTTNPVNSPLPISNPLTAPITVPGSQPITNPVTTYPSPLGNVPVPTPITTPASAPIVSNSPAIPGPRWCVAKTGATATALQAALDYACGIEGTECSMVQQGASCYNPNTLQNHASFAFNTYYQKNPAPTSCDFGGTAMVVNTNPSSGACIYPSSSSSSLASTPTIPSLTPTTVPSTTPPTITPPTFTPTTTSPTSTPPTTMPTFTPTASSSSGSSSPPTFFNTSNPASATSNGFGSESPPADNTTSESMSVSLRPFVNYIILATSFIAAKIILEI